MLMKRLVLALAPLATMACSSTYVAPTVRLSQIEQVAPVLERGQAAWIEFAPGDEFPFFVSADGSLFETHGAPLTVRVKKRFFVLIGDGVPKVSFDGVHVTDLPPGSFSIGFGATEELGPHARARVLVAPESAVPAPTSRPTAHR